MPRTVLCSRACRLSPLVLSPLLLALLGLALVVAMASPGVLNAQEPEATADDRAATGPDGPPADRIAFTLPVPEARGGGVVTGTAGGFEAVEEDYVELTGGVELFYGDLTFRADRVRYERSSGKVEAEGNVEVEEGDQVLTAVTARYDIVEQTGTFTDAEARVANDYFFTGAEVAKVDEDVYTVVDGTFTSCTGEPVPDWSFNVARARVRVDGYAKVKNAAFKVKKTPVLFTPYLLWPVREERTSGFLIPQPGYSSRRGASISLAYYQVLGRSYDTTIELDAWSDGFVGLGNEFRYRPSEDTEGIFVGYAVDDPDENDLRWKVNWTHETRNLPGGMRGVVNFQDFSDFEFFRDFERDFDDNTLRFLDSRGFLTGNWGSHSLNVLVNRRETFIANGNTVTLSKLPEIEYRLRPTRLGPVPLYLEVESSLDFLSLDRSEALNSEYLRADLFPQLTLPIRAAPWLSVSFTVGQRLTHYGDRLRTEDELAAREPEDVSRFAGDSLTRDIPFGSAELIGPSFSRIYENGQGGKLKHVIEPRWTYTFLDEFDEEQQVPLFDDVDTLRSTNVGRFSLIQRFLAKPPEDEEGGGGGSAREILSWELSQSFSFDEEQPLQRGLQETEVDGMVESLLVDRSAGPVSTLLRYNPTAGVSLKAEAFYNTLFDEVERTSLSSNWSLGGGNAVNLTWFTRTRPDTGESVQNQVRFGGSVALLPGRLNLRGQVNYDFEQGLLQQQRYIFDYTGDCCSISFEVRDSELGQFRDTDYRIAVSLKNVGTFLDITGGFSNRPR